MTCPPWLEPSPSTITPSPGLNIWGILCGSGAHIDCPDASTTGSTAACYRDPFSIEVVIVDASVNVGAAAGAIADARNGGARLQKPAVAGDDMMRSVRTITFNKITNKGHLRSVNFEHIDAFSVFVSQKANVQRRQRARAPVSRCGGEARRIHQGGMAFCLRGVAKTGSRAPLPLLVRLRL